MSDVAVVAKPRMVISPRTQAFWDAADEGRLLLQHCAYCGHTQHYARPLCVSCWSDAVSWHESAGRGAVWAFTVIHVPGHPAWKSATPYVVAVVELDEGPRIATNIVDIDPSDVSIGMRVLMTPLRDPDVGQTLLVFRPDVPGDAAEKM